MSTTTTSRRASIGAQRNPESETAILDAAESLLAEQGFSGFSIEAVARRARAGKPTIYRWWPNRVALLLAVYQRQKQGMAHHSTGSLRGDVEAFIASALGFWRDSLAGSVFCSVLGEAQHDAEAARLVAEFSAEKQGDMIERLKPLAPGATESQICATTELTMAYCYYRLFTGQLEDDPDAVKAVAERLTAGLGEK